MEEETRGEETMRLVAANIVICVLFLFSEERSMTTLIHCLKENQEKFNKSLHSSSVFVCGVVVNTFTLK